MSDKAKPAPPWIAHMTRLLRKVGEDHERAVTRGVEVFSRALAEARGERLPHRLRDAAKGQP